MKYFGIGLIAGLLISGIWFWNNPRIVQNTHFETITDTIYVEGKVSIDTTKKVSSGGISVEKQPNPDPCITRIDTVVVGDKGELFYMFSEDANKQPITLKWDIPYLEIEKVRVDTVKIFEMKTVEVEREVPWYGTPVAHAIYGIGILAVIVFGD